MNISTVIISYNEASNIVRCIESAWKVSTEVILVDSFSTDNTKKLASELNARVLERPFDDYIQQKNYGNAHASGDYILSLDADEWLSDKLIQEIKQITPSEKNRVYSFPRKNFYVGKFLEHGVYYPDRKIRLWKKDNAYWSGTIPHETLTIVENSEEVKLKHDLMHYAYTSVKQHYTKSLKYASLASFRLSKKSSIALLFKLLFSPSIRFFKDIFLKMGVLDGWRGVVVAAVASVETTMKYFYALKRKYS